MSIRKSLRRRLCGTLAFILAAVSLVAFAPLSSAAPEAEPAKKIYYNPVWKNIDYGARAIDKDHSTYATCREGASVTLTSQDDLGFFYIECNHAPGKWTASVGTKTAEHGQGGFIHEYVDVQEAFGVTKTVTFSFPAGTEITDIYSWGRGGVPDTVQRWEPALDKADIMLVPAHSDDDQLYFAGLLPYYCGVRGLDVQVVFFTEHLTENYRWHERLDALWTAGVRNYPVVSEFPDRLSYDSATAFSQFAGSGYSKETITGWLALQLRRFRPLVAVTHALDGEYGHGQHMAAAEALSAAADLAADQSFVTEGYSAYDLPKLYLHSDTRGQILIDVYDTPFEELGGETPFAVSQKGYLIHKSQYYYDLLEWMFGTAYPVSRPATITITRADQIKDYNPRVFGLVRRGAGVPEDVKKNDIMENLLSYAEQAATTVATEPPTEPETTPEETFPETTEEPTSESEPVTPAPTEPKQTREPLPPPDAGLSRRGDGVSRIPLLVLLAVVAGAAVIMTVIFGFKIVPRCRKR